MGGAVLLAPHGDDETLFAAFLAMKHQPHLIVCTTPTSSTEADALERWSETMSAWEHLCYEHDKRLAWEQWRFRDHPDTHYAEMAERIRLLPNEFDLCIAPAVEAGGHDHHNHVGHYALDSFGPERTIQYTTYRRGSGRTGGVPVPIEHSEWISRKLRALACYTSQIADPATRPWFLDPLTEYTAP